MIYYDRIKAMSISLTISQLCNPENLYCNFEWLKEATILAYHWWNKLSFTKAAISQIMYLDIFIVSLFECLKCSSNISWKNKDKILLMQCKLVSNSWNLCPSLALYNHKKIDLHHNWQTEIEVRSQRETIGTLDILDKDFQIG